MASTFATDLHVVTRVLLGVLFLSVGVTKAAHPRAFHRAIRDYEVFPAEAAGARAATTVLTYAIPSTEFLVALGLLTGVLEALAALCGLVLLLGFSGAIILNLARGRRDLSCHCGGMLGDHPISWRLLSRNAVLMLLLLAALVTTPDRWTLVAVFESTPARAGTAVGVVVLPALLLAGVFVAAVVLLVAAWAVLGPAAAPAGMTDW